MHKAPRIYDPWLWHGATAIFIVFFFALLKHLPMIATPGFESANLFVLVFAPWFALLAALPRSGGQGDFRPLFSKQLLLAGLNFLLYAALLWANARDVQNCSLGAGLGPFFIVGAPPLLLSVAFGTLIAVLIAKRWLRVLVLILAYAIYALVILYSWWQDPVLRLLTHGSLLISSDLLEGSELSAPIIGFRVATLLFALDLILIGLVFFTRKRFRAFSRRHNPVSVVLIVGILALALLLHKESTSMVGKNRARLLEDYSLVLSQEGFTVRADPQKVSTKEAENILSEALIYKKRLIKKLGSASAAPTTIWLHKNDDDKFLYTGAKNVHFANPKHRELHISGTTIPHGVLGHELAHIVVGEYSKTLWGVPGSFFLLPNLALTEGLAMMLTPELSIDADLSLMEQARALYQAGLGTNIASLFSKSPLQFISNNVHSSYIFSGAFIDFLLAKYEAAERPLKLKKIIEEGSVNALFENQKHMRDALKQFDESLSLPVDAFALLWAKNNFTAHSILATDCRDKYSATKKLFSRLLLNNETNTAIEALVKLPKEVQIDLLFLSFNNSLKKGLLTQALLLSKAATPLMIAKKDQRLNELSLSEAALHFHLNQSLEAQESLQRIDEKWLSPPLKRQFLIMREFLLSSHAEELNPAVKAAQWAIFDRSDTSEGSWILLASSLAKLGNEHGNTSALIYYIYARMLFRTHRYHESMLVLKGLKKNPDRLPEALLDQVDLLIASSLKAIGNDHEAKNAYEQILKKELPPSQRIAAEDAWERIPPLN